MLSHHAFGKFKGTGLILNEFFLVIKGIFLYITVCSCCGSSPAFSPDHHYGKTFSLVFLTSAKGTVAVIY